MNNFAQSTQLLIQVEATPFTAGSGVSPVVFSLCPHVKDLVDIFDQRGEHLPTDALDNDGVGRGTIFNKMDGENGGAGVVDEFWIIVSMHAAEILLDLLHLMLVVFILLVPWQAVELLIALCETECHAAWRQAKDCFDMYDDAKECLSEYRSEMIPLMNSLAKWMRFGDSTTGASRRDRDMWAYRLRFYSHEAVEKRLEHLEAVTWKEYSRHADQAFKKASKGNADVQQLGEAITSDKNVQSLRLLIWASKMVANSMSTSEQMEWASRMNLRIENETTVSSLLAEVVSEFEGRSKQLDKTMQLRIENALGLTYEKMLAEKRTMTCRKRCSGLFSKSTNELRGIIRSIAMLAARDLVFVCLFVLMLLTVVRTLPLLQDLAAHKAWRVSHCTTRRIVFKHLRGAGRDIRRACTFAFYALCVLVLLVGVPAFLVDIPKNFRNLEEATACAKRHLRETCRYLGELLLMFTAWRTYKLTATACIYAVLTPPACIAEALPKRLASVPVRLSIGVVVWAWGVLRCIWLYWYAEHYWEGNEDAVRTEFVALWGTFIGVIALCTLSLGVRSAYFNPIGSSASGFVSASWSHILCLALGPLESVQLASVVLYFYWYGTGAFQAGEGGAFTFPVVFLFDRSFDDSFDFSVAMGIAVVCVLIWIIMVTVPLIYDSSSSHSSSSKEGIRALQQSPAFDFTYVLFSRIIYVSIVATLMRPYSCVLSDDGVDELLVSTHPEVSCGGGVSWSSGRVTSILLLFFILTSTILHSDAPDLLAATDNVSPVGSTLPDQSAVRFAPIYAVVIRLGQLVICYLCLGFVSVQHRGPHLLAIIIVAGVLALWCALYPGRGCSLPIVQPIRAAGFVVVLWCAILCYIRGNEDWRVSSEFAFTGYRGVLTVSGALLLVGVVAGHFVQRRAKEMWKLLLLEAGLGDVVQSMTRIADLLVQEEAIGGSTTGAKTRAEKFQLEVQEALSAPHLGYLLVQFEEKILAERLNYDFLLHRSEWKRDLLRDSEPVTFETLLRSAEVLRSAVKPRAALATVNKHVLALIFLYKLPEYIAWEVFSFMYDASSLRLVLAPALTLNEKGLPPFEDDSTPYSYGYLPDRAFGLRLFTSARRNLSHIREEGFSTSVAQKEIR